jgi:hypothetical protein
MASERNGKGKLGEAIGDALHQFSALTGRDVASVTGVRTGDDGGWSVLVDVVELERIPATTSVMGTYRVDVDSGGDMAGYERLRRFTRGAVDPR